MQQDWVRLALSPATALRGLKFAFLVGPIYIIINHGDAILRGDIDATRTLKMILTMLVPFCVSVFSSILTVRHLQRTQTRAPEQVKDS
ncbi:MAG: nitrate/nitrite transporter NrtS [Acidobacteriota bacterium]|nr:nitrate/nitrite transporter NrtS [Acidobacteriota bacterium]